MAAPQQTHTLFHGPATRSAAADNARQNEAGALPGAVAETRRLAVVEITPLARRCDLCSNPSDRMLRCAMCADYSVCLECFVSTKDIHTKTHDVWVLCASL